MTDKHPAVADTRRADSSGSPPREVFSDPAPSQALREALTGLRNEARGILSLAEMAIREAVSNTNVNCLLHWLDQADSALDADKDGAKKSDTEDLQ